MTIRRRIPWDVLLALIFGAIVFLILDAVSFGVLGSLVTVGLLIGLFALGHYFLWGREMSHEAVQARTVAASATQTPADNIVLELSERERLELLRLLELPAGAPAPADSSSDDSTAIRRELVNKLRLLGA